MRRRNEYPHRWWRDSISWASSGATIPSLEGSGLDPRTTFYASNFNDTSCFDYRMIFVELLKHGRTLIVTMGLPLAAGSAIHPRRSYSITMYAAIIEECKATPEGKRIVNGYIPPGGGTNLATQLSSFAFVVRSLTSWSHHPCLMPNIIRTVSQTPHCHSSIFPVQSHIHSETSRPLLPWHQCPAHPALVVISFRNPPVVP